MNTTQSHKPSIGLYTTIAIVAGAMIGSGVFKKPAFMAEQLGSPELLLVVWILAGIFTLFGALTNAEIASMYPETGGQYVYFEKMYGKLTAFLYGWAIFAVIQTGSIASITYVFSEYSEYFFILPRFDAETEKSIYLYIPYIGYIYPLYDFGVKLLTIGIISFLTAANYFGVKYGGRISLIFTAMKLSALAGLVFFAFLSDAGNLSNLAPIASPSFGSNGIFGAFVAAFAGAFWAYDGWNNITFLAGEVEKPQINIPKALIIGMAIVITTYLLINIGFMYVLPIEVMAKSKLVAADVANVAIGGVGAGFVSAAVMISAFGTSNGSIMASSRVYYKMAKDKLFFGFVDNLHEKYQTPGRSLILQAFWASILVLSGTFDILTDMLIFVSFIFYGMGAAGVFVLRKKHPDIHRPYKVPGYPIVPLLFVIFAFAYVIFTLYNDIINYSEGNSQIINSLFGLLLVAVGLPFYFYFEKRNRQNR